ncbi:MAG: hypothetical protein IJN51_01015 [Alistipes sp.]|nr:hypothetical protein [Rikenellaceae bacterium]MBQ6939868.1 hypothetical protein [Alistipes sp.]MBQ8854002.1 hypothetical protein [Alistipes sp.]
MHLISNQQRREIIDFLTAFIELTADNGSTKVYNQKRRAGRLVKKLKENNEIDLSLVKALKDEHKRIQTTEPRTGTGGVQKRG